MASIFKRGAKFVIEWTDEFGRRRRKAGFTDKRLTQALAARLEREATERRAGVAPAGSGRDLLADMLGQWGADLGRLGRSKNYRAALPAAVRRVAAQARWRTVADLSPAGLTRFLGALPEGYSPRTRNQYRDACVRFGNWLVGTGRLATNPLARVRRARQRRVRFRRALTPAEYTRLLAACPPWARLSYQTAALSGLRRTEIKRLQARDVDRSPPSGRWLWRLRADATKAQRAEVLAMLPECQEVLEALPWHELALTPTAPLVPRVPRWESMQRHLVRAGVEPRDAAGRYADWHSLRYLFCTQLARHMPIQEVSVMMRHKSVSMTQSIYLDLGIQDLAERLATLPRLIGPKPDKKE